MSFARKALQPNHKPPLNRKLLHPHQWSFACLVSFLDAKFGTFDRSQIRDSHQARHPSPNMWGSFRKLARWLFSLNRASFLLRVLLQRDFICFSDEELELIKFVSPISSQHSPLHWMKWCHSIDPHELQTLEFLYSLSSSLQRFPE